MKINPQSKVTGADLGFSEGEAKPSSGSLEQGVWERSPPEAIGFVVFEAPKSMA